jgi:hypothetical protein
MKRLLVVLLVFAALIGYGGTGSSWAESDDALRTGIDAYLYVYPLVLMDVTRLYIEKATGAKNSVFPRGHVLTDADPKTFAPDDSPLDSGIRQVGNQKGVFDEKGDNVFSQQLCLV